MKDDPAKAARLAAALRDNLRKRKAQSRSDPVIPAKAGTQLQTFDLDPGLRRDDD